MHGFFEVPVGWRWVITLVFAAMVVAMSIAPGIARPGDSIFAWLVVHTATPLQKLMHVAIYALMAALWLWTLADISSRPVRFALAFALSVGLGMALEALQTNIPGRFGTITDVLLNAAGVLIGLMVAVLLL